MEVIQLNDDLKLEKRCVNVDDGELHAVKKCVNVDDGELHAVAFRTRKLRSYKVLSLASLIVF